MAVRIVTRPAPSLPVPVSPGVRRRRPSLPAPPAASCPRRLEASGARSSFPAKFPEENTERCSSVVCHVGCVMGGIAVV